MPVRRHFEHQVLVSKDADFSWDMAQRLSRWLEAAVAHRQVHVLIRDTDGQFKADTVQEAREHSERQRAAVDSFHYRIGNSSSVMASLYWYSRLSGMTVSFEGVDQTTIQGLAARLQQALDRGLLESESPAAPSAPTSVAKPTTLIRRVMNHPWTVAVGSGLVILLIGLTISFCAG